jgi:hypothetical protein
MEPIAWRETESTPDIGRDDDPTLLTENQSGIHE